MVPARSADPARGPGAPRARGDGPIDIRTSRCGATCSPRTRGWSRVFDDRQTAKRVLPAHAGMVPLAFLGMGGLVRAPRARGDGPAARTAYRSARRCSPRTRGWSRAGRRVECGEVVLPAHAGMVPAARPGPSPAPRAPRARGDGPSTPNHGAARRGCSPRTRGWSPTRFRPAASPRVLPAHAGMGLFASATFFPDFRAPRVRVYGPPLLDDSAVGAQCSPLTRVALG